MIVKVTISSASLDGSLPAGLAQISHNQVVLIELQGSLATLPHEGEQPGAFVGELTVDSDLKKPTLLIGHHLLEGKVATLPKAIAVMSRTQIAMETEEGLEASDNRAGNTEWTIAAVVKKKIVFNSRPTPVNLVSRKTSVLVTS